MPDTRKHRGPHPQDAQLFAPEVWPSLTEAVADLSWLLTRGYAAPSALKLVGDRFQLAERQRKAVLRSSCSDQALSRRLSTRLDPREMAEETLCIDGFNLLTTIEAALSGGVLLLGREGCLRDMASMHGSYRKVGETVPAISLIGTSMEKHEPAACVWYLDRPVSNSGRLSEILRNVANEHNWNWTCEIVNDPDELLRDSDNIVVSADSGIIDVCGRWLNLAREIVQQQLPAVQIVPLGGKDACQPG